MNLADLSAELEARADGVQPSLGTARLAALRGRARRRRRRQVGAVAVIAAGCALAFGVGPSLAGLHRDGSTPPARTDHPLKPFTFDDVDAGDPLVAHVVGAAGASDVEFRFTPTDTNLALRDFCYLEHPVADRFGTITINGHPDTETGCGESGATGGGTTTFFGDGPAANRASWAALGVRPGRESVVRIRLTTSAGASRSDATVRLGVGLYQMSGDRVTSGGVVIKEDAEPGDQHNYRLAGYLTAPITRTTRRIDLAVPAGRYPVYVVSGSPGVSSGVTRGYTSLSLDGTGGQQSSSGAYGGDVLEDAHAHQLTLSVDAATGNTGSLLLAYYVRVD
jgi:hypothetical protein